MGTRNWWQLLAVEARECHAHLSTGATHPHLVNAPLAPKWPPAVGQCGQVGVAVLFIIFLCFFFFILVIFFCFFLLCGCFVLARVPFCAYAILVYLLAILLAMNLFVFIVKPTAKQPQNTNKQQNRPRPTDPTPPTASLAALCSLKGYICP